MRLTGIFLAVAVKLLVKISLKLLRMGFFFIIPDFPLCPGKKPGSTGNFKMRGDLGKKVYNGS